jgi:hypothetical protein
MTKKILRLSKIKSMGRDGISEYLVASGYPSLDTIGGGVIRASIAFKEGRKRRVKTLEISYTPGCSDKCCSGFYSIERPTATLGKPTLFCTF